MMISRCGCHLYYRSLSYENGGGANDRSIFIRKNTLTFVLHSYRNYHSICLNYTGYNFEQIDKKKTHL